MLIFGRFRVFLGIFSPFLAIFEGLKKLLPNFISTPTIVLNWQIIEESLVVDAIPYHGIFDGNDHTITLSVDSAASITDIVIHYSVYSDFREYDTTPSQFKDAGTHTVYYRVTANGHLPVTSSCDVVITKKPIVIDPYDAQKRFGSSDPAFSAKVTGTVTGYGVSYELVRVSGEDAGNYTISVTNLSGIDNYDVTTLTGTFTIIPQALLSSMCRGGRPRPSPPGTDAGRRSISIVCSVRNQKT